MEDKQTITIYTEDLRKCKLMPGTTGLRMAAVYWFHSLSTKEENNNTINTTKWQHSLRCQLISQSYEEASCTAHISKGSHPLPQTEHNLASFNRK